MKAKKIDGRYSYLVEPIGKGSYGTVYKGKIIKTGEYIAVKVIDRSQFEDDEINKKTLKRQFNILKILNSPNIIKLIQVLESNKKFYIIQEFANEGCLADLIGNGKIGEEQAIEYLIQIVNGMAELVSNGFMHRDLKPENILIKDGILKIADFGQSKKTYEREEVNKSLFGTPKYMAPQILSKDLYSYKCDIWSLGAIMYEMVTGTCPWMNTKIRNYKDIYERIIRFTSDGIPFPSDVKISTTLQGFIRNCLQFNEYDRFDWTKIFLHPIFKGKFKMNAFANDEINSGFAMTKLRVSIHEQNINLEALFDQLPDELDLQDFSTILSSIQQSMNKQQSTCIFHSIGKNKNMIRKMEIRKYFLKSGINLQGITIEEMNRKYITSSDIQVKKTIENLCKIIDQKKIDMFDLFLHKKDFQNQWETCLSQQKFNEIMRHLDNSLDQHILQKLFIDFDNNNDGKISYNELYNKICKINRIIFIRDQTVAESLRRVMKVGYKNMTASSI